LVGQPLTGGVQNHLFLLSIRAAPLSDLIGGAAAATAEVLAGIEFTDGNAR